MPTSGVAAPWGITAVFSSLWFLAQRLAKEILGEPVRLPQASAPCLAARWPNRALPAGCARLRCPGGCRWTRRARGAGAARVARGGWEAFVLFQVLPAVALRRGRVGWTSEEQPKNDQHKSGYAQQPSDEKFAHGVSP